MNFQEACKMKMEKSPKAFLLSDSNNKKRDMMLTLFINAMTAVMLVSGFMTEPVYHSTAFPNHETAPVTDGMTEEAQVIIVKEQVFNHMKLLGREAEYECLAGIIYGESKWDPEARGDNGKSWGLVQRHIPVHGLPEQNPWTVESQVEWALKYADHRYGGACPAWKAWRGNIAIYGWGWW